MVMIDMVDVIEDEDRCVLRVILVVFSRVIEPRVECNSYESRSHYWLAIDPCSLLAFVQYDFSIPITVKKCIEAGNDRPRI